MNTFLLNCCFVPPEDDISVPSFSEHSPHSILSSRPSSRTSYELRNLGSKEIFYIKRFPKEAWGEMDEERISLNSSTSMQVLSGSTKSSITTTEPRQRKTDASGKIILMLNEEDSERMSFWLCGNGQQSMENCYYVPTRKAKLPRRLMTSSSRVLDFISMCFWRCSPGCQQIPTTIA